MRLTTFAVALATSSPVYAEPIDVSLQVHGGATTAPFITMELPHVDGFGAALLLDGRTRVHPSLDVGVRIPLALFDVQQPARSYVAEGAWGNPELFVVRDLALRLGTARPLFARARLAVGVPLAEHGAAGFMENRALAIADAIFAWRERELFTPGVLPVTPSVEVAMPFARWSAHAMVKLPVLVRVASAMPDDATNPVGLTPVVELAARAAIISRLEVTAGAGAAFDLVPPIEWVDDASRVQTSVHAELAWCTTGGLRFGANVLVPLGGALGGETFAGGISIAYAQSK